MVFHLRAAAPHELSQPEEILEVVARLPTAHGDLGADLIGAGRPQVERVGGSGDVEQRLNGWLALLLSVEIHHFGDVAATDRLAYVEVLEGLLNLRARHLEPHTPSGRLWEKGDNT